jgi:hypothetical protein
MEERCHERLNVVFSIRRPGNDSRDDSLFKSFPFGQGFVAEVVVVTAIYDEGPC